MIEPSSSISRSDLGERLLYGVKVRRVGGHEHQLCSPRFDELPYLLWPVRSEVVHHHHLSLTKGRSQKVLDVELEGFSVCGSLKAHRLSHPMQTLIEAIKVRLL